MNIYRYSTVSRSLFLTTRKPILLTNSPKIIRSRLLSLSSTKRKTPQTTTAIKKEKEKFRIYIVTRYIDYVKSYTKVLENRFPTAVRMYRVFSVGIKDFLRDLKTYISLRMKVTKDRGFSDMSRVQIELYRKMPSDMWRIAPVLLLSAVPFGNYVIFPLAFLKPKSLLCSHFWSIQQRVEFSTQDLTERLKHNRPVFRALQAKLDSITDSKLKPKWERVIALLGSGDHPSASEVLECKDLFSKGPYALNGLTYKHLGYLLKMHGYKRNLLRRNKLKYCAFILLEMDKAIEREGGVSKLSSECLRNACLIRGLYGNHLSNQDLRDWLSRWLEVSRNLDKDTYSLVLHCPILFAYNHPQNWMLIY